MTDTVKNIAPKILEEIQKSQSILLHCHPSPDPDSVCSALAMKLILEGMGKKATVIKGDSDIPKSFMHFPGADEIVMKNFLEIDQKDYDLFIIQDSDITRVTNLGEFTPLPNLHLVTIDHHATNKGGTLANLVDSTYPSCCELLYDVFSVWNAQITPDIARNLFVGMYTDTGGFKYRGVTSRTFETAGHLATIAPDFSKVLGIMENSNSPASIAFKGLALSSVEEFYNGRLALSLVSHKAITDAHIPREDVGAGFIAAALHSVSQWYIQGALIEEEPGQVKCSFRTVDAEKYDVSKLAVALGGGGHKPAAGATLSMTLEEAKSLVVAKVKELYNL